MGSYVNRLNCDYIREEIKQLLGIYQLGGMGSYLGIPESLGGAKTQVFGFLQERLHNRVNGWTVRFLTKRGKEVLIKSVVTALPTHVMSCFRLPRTVTKKLTSAVAHFWWSSTGNQKGMHWMSWDKLCRDKNNGGMGFRVIEDQNTALLAKQLWRLIDKPDSLFAKVFKGRYYRNSDPLDTIRAYSPSYGWRSISSARSMVSKGLIKRVESGTSISVWNDPWIPATQPRSAICKFRVYPPFTVNNLIDQETRTWNIPLLEATIIPEDVAIIKHIPLSRVLKQDTYGWHYTKHGKYTVKSGYEIEQRVPVSLVASNTYDPHLKPLLAHTWKVRCPPKMKHFMWQALSGCVSVTKNLRSRGIQCDTQCTRCGAEEETINHVLFECPPAIQTWALSNIPSNPQIFPLSSVYSNFDYLFWRIPKGLVNNYFPWIIWYLWKNRNDNIFNNRDKKPDEILRIAEMEGKLWEEAQAIDTRNEEHSSLAQYPELVYDGWWCLIDGSWKESDIYSGQGWYYSKEGVVEKRMGSRNNRASLTPLHAEFEALIWAMECMKDFHHQDIIFGTDCSDLVKIVSNPEDWPAFTTHIEEFNIWKEHFTPFSIKLIPRARNTKADKLARSARTLTSEAFHAASVPPSWIKKNF